MNLHFKYPFVKLKFILLKYMDEFKHDKTVCIGTRVYEKLPIVEIYVWNSR